MITSFRRFILGWCACTLAVPLAARAQDGELQLIRNVEQQRQVIEGGCYGRFRVRGAIAKARADMRTNPQGAIDLLKHVLQAVISTPEMPAEARRQLRNEVEQALQQAIRVRIIIEPNQVEAPKRLVESLRESKESKLSSIMHRFEFLMAERNFQAAEELAPLSGRRNRFSAADLADQSPSEKRIRSVLNNGVRIEFIETPLVDVIDFLRDEHEIPIQLDKKAMEGEWVDTATPITMNLAGVSLRSGIRRMLDPLGLTYVIKNEVLLITTKAQAVDDLIAKVYPVAHLGIPIRNVGLNGSGGDGLGGCSGFNAWGGDQGQFGGGGESGGGRSGGGGRGVAGFF